MEDRMYKVFSPNDSKVAMKVIPGHFVTTHSHITHYVDMTTLRARQNEAEAAARILASKYANNTPVQDINGQMIFRDNSKIMVEGKNVLILSTSITTGVTLDKAIDSVEYYGGKVQGIASIFSFISKARGIEVNSIFDAKDLKGYASYDAKVCPMCKAKQKIDAIVNGYGYSKM